MGVRTRRCWGAGTGSSVPGFLEVAGEREAQGHSVPSVSEVRCHLARVWLAAPKLGAPPSLLKWQSVTPTSLSHVNDSLCSTQVAAPLVPFQYR